MPDEYYDIQIKFSESIDYLSVSEYFYVLDLKQRKLFLKDEINQLNIDDITRHIMQYNADDIGIEPDKRRPIKLYLTSNGGAIDVGFELIDVILNSKTPVYTINTGYQYSMGFLVGLAGHKRFCTSNAKFLMHDGTEFVWASGSKVQDQMEFSKRNWERIKEYVMSRSNITEEEYDEKKRVEWYMFADEAKEKGFTDYIVGVDCDIEEII